VIHKAQSEPVPYRYECKPCGRARSLRDDQCPYCGSGAVVAIMVERRRSYREEGN
jgi:rRNA maturation endonuclease Nob1